MSGYSVASWTCQRCKAPNGFGDMMCASCQWDGRQRFVDDETDATRVVSGGRADQHTQSEDLRARTTGDRPAWGPMETEWLRMEGEARQDYVARISMVCKDLAGRMFGGGK